MRVLIFEWFRFRWRVWRKSRCFEQIQPNGIFYLDSNETGTTIFKLHPLERPCVRSAENYYIETAETDSNPIFPTNLNWIGSYTGLYRRVNLSSTAGDFLKLNVPFS
jgi:hypothetical protein